MLKIGCLKLSTGVYTYSILVQQMSAFCSSFASWYVSLFKQTHKLFLLSNLYVESETYLKPGFVAGWSVVCDKYFILQNSIARLTR